MAKKKKTAVGIRRTELDDYLHHAQEEVLPKMEESALSLIISGPPDAKLCLELGAAILYDKPIVVIVPDGRPIPANLKRVAAAIVEGDPRDPATGERLQKALSGVVENDRRKKGIARC